MNTYVVLLRGINVGGKNIVPMAGLKTCLEELGFAHVSTYIASGNVILESDKPAAPLYKSMTIRNWNTTIKLLDILRGNMSYQVTMTDVEARPTAVVPATTTWQEFPTLWRELSNEVWACLHAGGISRGCRNIMLYWDDVPHVEVGVELLVPCPLTGRVRASALPAGQVAMTVHWGPYARLGEAHQAVLDWCAAQGKQKTGTRWEVYGPHNDDPAKVWTEVYWLLA